MRIAALLLLALPAFAADTIEAFGLKWTVPSAADWAVEGAGPDQVLKMLVPHPDTRQLPRRPVHFAVAETAPFDEVAIDVEVRRRAEKDGLIIVYAWQAPDKFNYAHFSPDSPEKQPVHSGIFHVYGGDRVRISAAEGPATLPTLEWTLVHLEYSAKTHLCEVTVNGKKFASLRGVDLSLGAGRVGLGSFFNATDFRRFRIKGK